MNRHSGRRPATPSHAAISLVLIAAVAALAPARSASLPDVAGAKGPPSAFSLPLPGADPDPGQDVSGVGVWRPEPGTSWQWQLTSPVDESVEAAVYDVDLFDNGPEVVASLHARGRKAICYLSAGSWESWRPDADRFPPQVLGRSLDGWPGERWLDVRRIDVLRPIVEDRLDLCRAKGFDGVEPDNVDGYANDSGFPLTAEDQLRYNVFLAAAAHARGLSVGLKNDLDQVEELSPYFDWAVNEQCFEYDECEALEPFIAAGKAVFHVEYRLETRQFCPRAIAMRFSSMRKDLSLDEKREPCR